MLDSAMRTISVFHNIVYKPLAHCSGGLCNNVNDLYFQYSETNYVYDTVWGSSSYSSGSFAWDITGRPGHDYPNLNSKEGFHQRPALYIFYSRYNK